MNAHSQAVDIFFKSQQRIVGVADVLAQGSTLANPSLLKSAEFDLRCDSSSTCQEGLRPDHDPLVERQPRDVQISCATPMNNIP